MKLTPIMKDFVVHWGEMGTYWGINRTVAKIHALLFISPEPLSAEEIVNLLVIARSNVSSSLKELENWGVIKVVHKFADRKEYYESLKDVWEVASLILDQRKKREIDPAIKFLKQCLEEHKSNTKNKETDYSERKLKELLSLFETASTGCNQIRNLPIKQVLQFINLGRK